MAVRLIAVFLLFSYLTSCHLNKAKYQLDNSVHFLDMAQLWRSDTCGVFQDRLLIAPILEKKERLLVGMRKDQLIFTFGFPDDLIERDTFIEMYYSLSSIEIFKDGSCGPAAIAGFYFNISKKSKIVFSAHSTIH